MRYQTKICCFGIFVLLISEVFAAQIVFRNRDTEPRVQDYNIKVGSLSLDLRYKLGVIFDDNSNRATRQSNEEDGIKIGNAITTNIEWPINSNVYIQSGVTFAYLWYLSGEGADGFSISGGEGDAAADIAFDLKVGQNGLLTLRERLTRDLDSVEIDRIDNAEDFSLWRNSLSLQYQNQLSTHVNLGTQILRRNVWAGKSRFDFRDHTTNMAIFNILWAINTATQAGPYATYSASDYDNRDSAGIKHNDLEQTEFGINFRYKISPRTMASLALGYQFQDISGTNNNVDDDEDDGFSSTIVVTNRLTDIITHNINFSFTRNLGTSSTVNFSEDLETSYSIRWKFMEKWLIRGRLTWLKTNESSVQTVRSQISTPVQSVSNINCLRRRTCLSTIGGPRSSRTNQAEGANMSETNFVF